MIPNFNNFQDIFLKDEKSHPYVVEKLNIK